MRVLTILSLGVGALAFAAGSSAHGKPSQPNDHHGNTWRFTVTLTSTDDGTCHITPWATDTLKRTYTVHRAHDGSYSLTQRDKGTFVTTAGDSPGKCEAAPAHHGSTVTAGIKGKVNGFLSGKVIPAAGATSTTFTPTATCPADCSRATFLATFFGAGATHSCDVDKSCRYSYVYRSNDKALKYHAWLDAGRAAATGGLVTRNRGDIATA
jgi:hypothetical protein